MMRGRVGIMPDTQVATIGIQEDTEHRLRLTDAAIERAKRQLNIDGTDAVGEALGFSRMTFYRLRTGQYDIRLSRATAVAERIGWPINRVFERVTGA